MRIQLYASDKTRNDEISGQLISVLERLYQGHSDVLLTDENPDIVHVFGAWEHETAKFASFLYRKTIPYVYSPLGGLLPWKVKRSSMEDHQLVLFAAQKRMTVQASMVHVCGKLEKQSLEESKWNKAIIFIKNPVITNDITEEQMAEEMLKTYGEIIASYHFKVHEEIQNKVNNLEEEDENIRLIYGKILAIQHQYNRGNVMQESLDELSHIMTAAEYDEDAMEALLQKHRLDLFAARLEQVLLDNSTLTEGFTTLPPRQDKVTDLIKNSITHYQQ